jgi:protein-S-isoprenylcysteine O-methyltransferase Ste14
MSTYIKIGSQPSWIIVVIYWFVSSIGTKKATSRESFFKRFVQYWFPLIIAVLLLGPGEWFGHSLLRDNFVSHNDLVGNIGMFLSLLSAFIACWLRYLLGKNWSMAVQRKKDHELVQIGIYKTIRHPIYMGLLLIFIGNTFIVGD